MLQHSVKLTLMINILIYLCIKMNYIANKNSTNTYVHFYHQYEKNCLNIIFLACGLDEISENTVGTVMFWGIKNEYF